MNHLEVSGTFNLIGTVPGNLHDSLVLAVRSVPQSCFFDEDGKPLKTEVLGFDKAVASALKEYQWDCQQNYRPMPDCNFNVDLAVAKQKVLIEIEKGNLPRLELDILKVASACSLNSERWQYGSLVVPTSYIKLPLAGRESPYKYLKRLAPLIKPILAASLVRGFLVIGYSDPRA